MQPTVFKVLYRQFLFRMVDIDLLSADAQGDMGKLFGQFAALLIFISLGLCLDAGMAGSNPALEWSGVHFMIATTMLVVGLFAILSWDSTFPDRRDVMVLGPLPVGSRTIFFAKVAAVATALSVTVAALHLLAGFVWPLSLNNPHEATMAPSIAYDSALAPVSVAQLEAVLKKDLEPVLKRGLLAPGSSGGVTIGVWRHGQQRVFAFGAAKADSMYEIGSVTKTFTALVLAQMVNDGRVRLDEPVRELLPPGTVGEPAGTEITLLDLATHRSGLPHMPNALGLQNPRERFKNYRIEDLYAFLKWWGMAKPRYASFEYSNLGFGLLGHALTERAGVSYAELLRGITEPLELRDTVLELSPEQRARLIQGYTGGLRMPEAPMELGIFASAGAILSTAGDMLRYLQANLHPEIISGPNTGNGIRRAMAIAHQLRARISPDASIALSWISDPEGDVYWHNGGTLGYTSDARFSRRGDFAVIVLTNTGPDLFAFASVLGQHIRARLAGERAVSMNAVPVPAGGGGFLDFPRLLAVWWFTMLAAGAFVYCCVLGMQGIAAQFLPRRLFLRVSSFLQLAAFGVFVCVYFLEPKLVAPSELAFSQSSAYLEWSPSYWFTGLFEQLNGSPALRELAVRGWIAIAVVFSITALAYTLAYFRTLRRIVEEPDIAPDAGGRTWLPSLGNSFATAIGQFSARTLLRSRGHRLLLAFYLGIAFASAILFKKSDEAAGVPEGDLSLGPLCTTVMLALLCVVGMRVVFSLPIDMRANWIFRIVPLPGGPRCMAARRRALYALSVLPVCIGSAALLFWGWPWQAAAKHLVVIALLSIAIAEICLHGTQKLPFTCSYLPGKSNFNFSFLLSSMLVYLVIAKASLLERESFDSAVDFAAIVALLATAAGCLRWSAARLARSPEGALQFEEAAEPAVFVLDLHRDGTTQVGE